MLELSLRKTLSSGKRRFTLDLELHDSTGSLVVMGPSGAGKSLLLRMVAGLTRPDQGRVCLAGRVLFDSSAGIDLPPQARGLAYLFQDYALFPHLTVRQNIAFGLKRGWLNPGRRHASRQVDTWLDRFGLTSLQHQHVDELSGGQRQRTALARALVLEPRALLLDEPFAALDHSLRQHLRGELAELLQRLQVPLLLISHDHDDLECFGRQAVYLEHGRISGTGATCIGGLRLF